MTLLCARVEQQNKAQLKIKDDIQDIRLRSKSRIGRFEYMAVESWEGALEKTKTDDESCFGTQGFIAVADVCVTGFGEV